MSEKPISTYQLQLLLINAGHHIRADGAMGPQTLQALREYQRNQGLVVDGIPGPRTLAALQGSKPAWALTQASIENAARHLGLPVAVVHAIAEVESRGIGFTATGEPSILFERHIMLRRMPGNGTNPAPYLVSHPNLVNRLPGGYSKNEYARLASAKTLCATSAIESTSWGRFQIMGLHWQVLGYSSAQAFEAAMRDNEDQHLEAFVRFIEKNPAMLRSLKQQNFDKFASLYNGPEYRKNNYGQKLETAFNRHTGKRVA